MDGFEIVLTCLFYTLCALVFAALMDKDDNIIGYAFIWPLIALISILKALLNLFYEVSAELRDGTFIKKRHK
jgi:hypothetical protein